MYESHNQLIAQVINSMAHQVTQVVLRCEDANETQHLGNCGRIAKAGIMNKLALSYRTVQILYELKRKI